MALLLALSPTVPAQTDTSPPVLVAFSFSPAAIDTTDSPATVLVTIHATDDFSGVASVRATFSNRDVPSDPLGCESVAPDSGTSLDGTYSCPIVFPRYSDPGTWQVLAVEIVDVADHPRLLLTADLAGMGFPTDLEVTTEPDLSPPALTGFSFLPLAIDTSEGAAAVRVTFHVTDDRSGVAWAKVTFLGPGGGGATRGCTGQAETPGQEAPLDTVLTCDVDFPQLSPEGTWSVVGVDAADAAGNNAPYPTSSLVALGFPAQLLVTTQPDTGPPGLTGFSFSPAVIDTENAAVSVEVFFTVADDLTGVALVEAVFASPDTPPLTLGCTSTLPSTGSPLAGAYHCLVPFPAAGPEGPWKVSRVEVRDAQNNSRLYPTTELAQAGFPVDLASGFVPGSPRGVVEAPAAGRSIQGNNVTVAARLIQGGPGEVSPSAGVRLEFRPVPSGSFAPIPSAETSRPNPDSTYPYFIHWDVSGLPDGDYELRAVAHDPGGVPDPAPAVVPIRIANGVGPDIAEGVDAGGRQESRTAADNSTDSVAQAGDRALRGGLVRFSLPAGSLIQPVDIVRMFFPDEAGELPRLEQPEQSTGVFVDVTLESGQIALSPGPAGILDLQYLDANRDGVVDGTGVPERDLELRRLDEGIGKYVRLPPWTLLTEHNKLHAVVTQLGRFALTRSLEPRVRFAPDGQSLEWDPITEALSYNVYRGTLDLLDDLDGDGLPDGGYGSCQNHRDPDLADTFFVDGDAPGGPGQGFFYLATFTGAGGERGLGSTSRGLPRSVIQPCP